MDNTDLIQIFRDAMNPDATLEEFHPGPAELGGPNQQRLTTHFKLNEPGAYEKWGPKAMAALAQMVTYSFPSPIQFYRLDVPEQDNLIEDEEVCIREFRTEVPEVWSEPAEDLTEEQLKEFVPRKKWDAHTRVTFETIFRFGI